MERSRAVAELCPSFALGGLVSCARRAGPVILFLRQVHPWEFSFGLLVTVLPAVAQLSPAGSVGGSSGPPLLQALPFCSREDFKYQLIAAWKMTFCFLPRDIIVDV